MTLRTITAILLAAFALTVRSADEPSDDLGAVMREAPVIAEDATAPEMLEKCRAMVPEKVAIEGRIILRNRRGIVQAEHAYALEREGGRTTLVIDGEKVEAGSGSIAGTDVTWSDLSLDYLWWSDVSFDAEKESETVHGQVCTVVLLKNGERTVRIWIDRRTGAMMQAEELEAGRVMRRMWGTRIKKFGERWAPNVLEVETVGSGHRTKITVEKLK